ncbi:MAG: FAD-binding oxidoreductase [Pseudomonadota bacterium]
MRPTRIGHLPQNDKTNAWNTILPERTPHAALDGSVRADWLVVGAGYAGLAAARRLAEHRPDEKVVVLDAGICGENASGRNSGFGIDTPHTTSSNLDQLDSAHAQMRLARAALSYLEAQVTEHAIECDWARDGKYQTAVTDAGSAAMLEPFAAELDALGEPYRWVRGSELHDKLGTAHFAHAVYTPGCILMNPAALTRGLADTMPPSVAVHEESPVIEIDYRNGVQARTPGGEVRAPRMILAANGFSEQFGFHQNKFIHLGLNASLSRPLTDAEAAVFGVERPWGVTPANAFGGITMRYTPDRRLLIRENIEVNEDRRTPDFRLKDTAKRHKALFDHRFPQLPEVSMENTWTGYICMSRNGAPAFGRVASNVWIAACQNGVGVTKATVSGMLAADMACGVETPLIEDMLSLGSPDNLPARPLAAIGSRAYLAWETWKNRHEA